MITITRDRGATTEHVDERFLLRRDAVVDNETETATSVEYCLPGCEGPAHATGVPDAIGHFCDRHVHRSAHVVVKRAPGAAGALGALNQFDAKAWAKAFVDDLERQYRETGKPIEFNGRFSPEALDALKAELAARPHLNGRLRDR